MATTRTSSRPSPGTGANWSDPSVNPEQANAEIAKVLAEVNTTELPVVDFPPGDVINLPGGLVRGSEVIKVAQVKELTGEDEESLARASQSMNSFIFLDRLLKCGTVKVGAEPTVETEKLIAQLLIGDREALILGIREATYGNKLEVPQWICPNCNVKADLTMELSDIPVVTLADPVNDTTFKVPMRKGGFALVRLATGADQLATYEQSELSQAQRETVLLSKCVITLTDSAGIEKSMAAFPSLARSMSIPDRHAILNALRDRQPGPKFDQVKYTCSSCNEESNVVVTIGNLFLDLGWI